MRRDAIGASFVVSKTLPPLRMSDLSNTRYLVVVLIVLIVVEYTVYIHIRVNDFDIYTLTTERREVFEYLITFVCFTSCLYNSVQLWPFCVVRFSTIMGIYIWYVHTYTYTDGYSFVPLSWRPWRGKGSSSGSNSLCSCGRGFGNGIN